MNPVTITHRDYASVEITTVIPAWPGLFVLEKWEISDDPADDDLRGHPVLSWCIDKDRLLHYPNMGNGIIQADFCVFDAGGRVTKLDGFDPAGIKTVHEWIAEVRAKNSPRKTNKFAREAMAKAYGSQQPR